MTLPKLKFALEVPQTKSIEWLDQQNVVAHITFANKHSRTDKIFFGTPPQPQKKGIKDPNSPFMHKRHDCGDNGKFLQFESKNSIRAGKRSHADAVHSVYKWKKFIGNPKIASITTPNLVASGQFKHKINIKKLKQLPTANYSKKFPGISVEAIKGVTPEIYPSKTRPEKFIIPGIKSDIELNQVLKILDTIAEM